MSLYFQLLLKIGHSVLSQVSPNILTRFCKTSLSKPGITVPPAFQGSALFISILADRFTELGELLKVPDPRAWRPQGSQQLVRS